MECEGTALYNDKQTVALIAEGVKVFGQLIFDTEPLSADLVKQSGSEVVDSVNLIYSLNGTSKAEITILASAYSVTDSLQYYRDAETKSDYFQPIIASNLEQTQKSEDQDFKQVFDYQTEMQNYNVSYIACRVPEMYEKFSKDPLFDLVFINSEVAIFKVKGNIGQDG